MHHAESRARQFWQESGDSSKGLLPPDDDDSVDGVGDTKGKGVSTNRLYISSREINSAMMHPSYVAASAVITPLLQLADISPKKLMKIMERGPCRCLIMAQAIFWNKNLRKCDEVLNLLCSKSPMLNVYFSYGHVADPTTGKRRGYSEDFALHTGLQANWLGGKHELCNLSREGAMLVNQAVEGATSLAVGSELDSLVDPESFSSMITFYKKQAYLTGYPLVPISGYSIEAATNLLSRFRKMIPELGVDKQAAAWQLLADFYTELRLEGGAYYVQQMSEVSPAGKQLDGYLGSLSGAAGFMKKIARRLRTHKKFQKFAIQNPGVVQVAATVSGGKRPSDWLEATGATPVQTQKGGGDDDVKTKDKTLPAIGSAGKKVKWCSDNPDFFTLGKNTLGPLSEFVAEYKIPANKVCGPVAMSNKRADMRCTLCDCTTNDAMHKTRNTLAHKPVDKRAGWEKKYMRPTKGFVLPLPRQPVSP